MDRRTKASLHRDTAARLNETWAAGAIQARYSNDGHWYATLTRFPAALFDATGYLLFATEEQYRASPHIRLGKQISVPKPGISAIPGYVRMVEEATLENTDVDVHDFEAVEGNRQLVVHLQRERNQTLVRKKKKSAASLNCEACGFSFRQAYGKLAEEYCEVHHLVPLAEAEKLRTTRLQDLAILCANCHRVVHLRNPPCGLLELKELLAFGQRDA
jgi:hypothetical protein